MLNNIRNAIKFINASLSNVEGTQFAIFPIILIALILVVYYVVPIISSYHLAKIDNVTSLNEISCIKNQEKFLNKVSIFTSVTSSILWIMDDNYIINAPLIAGFFIPKIIKSDISSNTIKNKHLIIWLVLCAMGRYMPFFQDPLITIGASLILVALAELKKGSIGYGDIKLFAVIAAQLTQKIEIMALFAFLTSALGIILLLILRHKSIRYPNNGVPLAPTMLLSASIVKILEPFVTVI